MDKILLLLSSVPEDRIFAGEVAKVCELQVAHVPTAQAAAKLMDECTPMLTFVDGSTPELHQEFENAVQEAMGLFSDKVQPNSISFISDSEINEALYLIHSPILGSYLMRDHSNSAEAGLHYGRIMKASLLGREFQLNKVFKSKVQTLRIVESTQKGEALEALRAYLEAAQFQSRVAASMVTAVDELLMNAIFDAPIDDTGTHIHSTAPRTAALKLDEKNAVELNISFDGAYVGVSVVDQFGSLDKARLLTHISKEYSEKDYKIKSGVAGAGIGLTTIHRTGGSLFFFSESRVRTEVTIFFKKVETYKDFKRQFRFVSTQFYL